MPSVEHYQREATRWSAAYDAPTAGGQALRERLRRVQEALSDAPAGVLLDVGCGTGVVAAAFRERGWHVLGVDAAPSMVAEARGRLRGPGGLGAAVADADTLPVRSGRVDAALCLGVLDHLPDPRRTVAELARVLRPGGRVVLTTPNRQSPYALWSGAVWRPAVGAVKARAGRLGLDSRSHLLTRRQAAGLARAAGLDVLSCRGYWFNLLLPPLDQLLPRTAERLSRRLEPWHRSRRDWLGAGWVLVAQKPLLPAEAGLRSRRP